MVNNMSDKELLLKAIENDIKIIEKCIEECIDEDTIDYLEAIKQDMLIFKLEILKRITIDKMLNEKQYEKKDKNCNDEQFDTFIKLLTNGLVYGKKGSGE